MALHGHKEVEKYGEDMNSVRSKCLCHRMKLFVQLGCVIKGLISNLKELMVLFSNTTLEL